jgi:hypothetical protein
VHPQARVTAAVAQLLAAMREQAFAELPPAPKTAPTTDDDVSVLVDRIVRRAQYAALREVLVVVNGWVAGTAENHEAMQHRGNCCRDFAPADFRQMLNDAARNLGTTLPVTAADE